MIPKVLCHPGGGKSCGACCGMYNRVEGGEEATMRRLAERTSAFGREVDVEDPKTLEAFRAKWEQTDPRKKLLEGLPNCPFLGVVERRGGERGAPKVGCLVHPRQNGGLDGRDCGVYDRRTCEDYLCAAHDLLRPFEKRLVVEATRDSYVYGLVVTDVKFVKLLTEKVAEINGRMPRSDELRGEDVIAAAAGYFELKRDWPWAASDGVFGQVVPGRGLETRRREGPSEALGEAPGPWDAVLRCLGTRVTSVSELEEAREVVRARVHAVAEACSV